MDGISSLWIRIKRKEIWCWKMNFLDLNSNQKDTILLIHPMLSSAQGMKALIADQMGKEFRYIIPDLSAHGQSASLIYESALKESQMIYDYLKEHHIKELRLAFGASLGGVVLLQLLNYKDIKFEKLVFEGISLWTNAPLLDVFTRYLLLIKHRKALRNRDLAVRKMVALYGEQGEMMADSFIAMDEESIRHISHDCAFVALPNLTPEEQESCVFFYGSREFDSIAAKKVVPQKYPHAKFYIWQGYDHCRKITENPRVYCKLLEEMIKKNISSNEVRHDK